MNYDEVLNVLNYIYEYFPDLNERGVYEILCNFGLTNDDVEGELSSNLLHIKYSHILKGSIKIFRDKYIKDGLNKCNPFVPTNWNKSGVGVLNIDEDISKSYNETISSCIAEYIHYQRGIDSKYYNFMKIKKENPNPEEPTVEGFYKYIEENHKFLNEDVRVQTLKLLKNSLIIGRQLDLNNKKRI